MARIFENKKWLCGCNNGVYALVLESDWEGILAHGERVASLMGSTYGGTTPVYPVFTFAPAKSVEKQPWYTGSTEFLGGALTTYITKNGGKVAHRFSVFVPFSNGYEKGIHGDAGKLNELRWATTPQQFKEKFGATIDEIVAGTA
jgi:hypothetical protein